MSKRKKASAPSARKGRSQQKTKGSAKQLPQQSELDKCAANIRALGKQTVENVIEIGRLLIEVKEIAGHGNWLPWLDREFGWTDKTAENFMNLHKLTGSKIEKFSNLNLPVSALYLLAAPSTPEAVRDEIIKRAEAGDITVAEVKQTLAEQRAEIGRETQVAHLGAALAEQQAEVSEIDPAEAVEEPISNEIEITLEQWNKMSAKEKDFHCDPENFPSDVKFNTQNSDGIDWGQKSWNAIVGCKHSCDIYCYAKVWTVRFPRLYPHGFKPVFRPRRLHAPRNTPVPREAAFDGRYKNVFTGSMADMFGGWVPPEWIEAILAEERANPQWNFLHLTKFPNRLIEFDLPPNTWIGTTVDLQIRVPNAEAAFAKLRERNPNATLWLSVEPMLEPIKFKRLELFNWMVIGGASRSMRTPEWRPPHRWIDDLIAQADAVGCKIFEKTNLRGNRILELPVDAPIKSDYSQVAPEVFHYLGKAAR